MGATTSASLTPKVKFADKTTQILEVGEDIMDMITQLQQEWIKLHEDHANTYKKLDLARKMQNRRKNRNLTQVQYRPGDWVLYSTQPTRKNKLQPFWVGPFRVTEVVARNVYKVEDLMGKVREVHASRLWFYNTSGYVPKQHEERLFRQHWSGFELDSVANVDQDENGNLIVFVRWYGFPDDDPTELTVTQMLDGGHLLLDKYLEDNKEDIRPAIYTAFKQRIHDYQKSLKNTSLISVEPDSTPESYWKRSLGDFRALRYRYDANPPDNFTRDAFSSGFG